MLVKQKNNHDCMLAAIAAVLDKEYDELWSSEVTQRVVDAKGCNSELTAELLKSIGYTERVNYWHVYLHSYGHYESVKRLFNGRRAIFSVPSLNTYGSNHAIAWDGKHLLDPSTKMVYTHVQSIMIDMAIIFNEIK